MCWSTIYIYIYISVTLPVSWQGVAAFLLASPTGMLWWQKLAYLNSLTISQKQRRERLRRQKPPVLSINDISGLRHQKELTSSYWESHTLSVPIGMLSWIHFRVLSCRMERIHFCVVNAQPCRFYALYLVDHWITSFLSSAQKAVVQVLLSKLTFPFARLSLLQAFPPIIFHPCLSPCKFTWILLAYQILDLIYTKWLSKRRSKCCVNQAVRWNVKIGFILHPLLKLLIFF